MSRTVYLLDVNVLIALIAPAHVHHDVAHEWFAAKGRRAWATCPLTQNGVLRIVGHARYPNSPGIPGTPASVSSWLGPLVALPGHTFWPDDVSLLNDARLDASRLLSSTQVTDSYLLALAVAHQGSLASFDKRLVTNAIDGGAKALSLIA